MICLCIKDKLLETYECNSLVLSLCQMSCSWCKKIQNDGFEINDSNKYQMMFIESLFCTMRRSKEVIMRAFDVFRLEKIQNRFIVDENCDTVMHDFFEKLSKVNDKNYLNVDLDYKKCYKEMSEYTFLEIIKRLIFYSQFSFAQAIILDYFQANVIIHSSSFRQRFYFRPKKSDEVNRVTISPDGANYQYYSCAPFFDIGWALDEGSTESFTREAMDKMMNIMSVPHDIRDNNLKTQYFFEVKFYEKIMSLFGEEKRKELRRKIDYKGYATTFLLHLTNYSNDKCDFYNLYHYTDNQNWKEANLLLKKILSSNIDVESL